MKHIDNITQAMINRINTLDNIINAINNGNYAGHTIRIDGCDKAQTPNIYIDVNMGGDTINVHTPYCDDYIARIKSIDGRRWDDTHTCWVVPASAYDNVMQIINDVYGTDGTADTTIFGATVITIDDDGGKTRDRRIIALDDIASLPASVRRIRVDSRKYYALVAERKHIAQNLVKYVYTTDEIAASTDTLDAAVEAIINAAAEQTAEQDVAEQTAEQTATDYKAAIETLYAMCKEAQDDIFEINHGAEGEYYTAEVKKRMAKRAGWLQSLVTDMGLEDDYLKNYVGLPTDDTAIDGYGYYVEGDYWGYNASKARHHATAEGAYI